MTTSPPTPQATPDFVNPYKEHFDYIRSQILQAGGPEGRPRIERAFLIALTAALLITPSMAVKCCARRAGLKSWADYYVAFKLMLLIALLVLGLGNRAFSPIVAAVLLIDLYLYLAGVLFLEFWPPPASYLRSLLLLGTNLIESILAFSVFYLYTASIARSGIILSAGFDAIYFSVVTAATVGYGDFVPINVAGRIIVTLQILSTFIFVSVVLSNFVSNFGSTNAPGKSAGQKPVA